MAHAGDHDASAVKIPVGTVSLADGEALIVALQIWDYMKSKQVCGADCHSGAAVAAASSSCGFSGGLLSTAYEQR